LATVDAFIPPIENCHQRREVRRHGVVAAKATPTYYLRLRRSFVTFDPFDTATSSPPMQNAYSVKSTVYLPQSLSSIYVCNIYIYLYIGSERASAKVTIVTIL